MRTIFGPSGIPLSMKGKGNVEGLKYSVSKGLKAYEIEFVRGVNLKTKTISEINELINNKDIKISCHAPYYINCNNKNKYRMTRRFFFDCFRVNQELRLKPIVFHTGFLMNMKRDEALRNSIETIKKVIIEARSNGFDNFTLGPEVAGKKYQVGTLNEVINICKEINECKPVIDWGHLHAISNGGLKTINDFQKTLSLIENELGSDYLKGLHCHFSKIEYGPKGELRHHALNSDYGPDFKILAELINKNDYEFTIISETPLIDEDALRMKAILNNLK